MPDDTINDKKMPLAEHLTELRKRLFYCVGSVFISFIVCYIFKENIYAFLVKPLADAYGGDSSRRLIYTGLTEAFFTYIKVSTFAAIVISFPIIASQLYMFLAPGLYKKEKRVILPFLIAAPALFLLGAALVYYLIFPLAWQFFISFENTASGVPIQLEARVSEYLSLVIQLILGFGFAFQLPIILTLLAYAGIISSQSLVRKRKYAIVGIFIVAAILTPPDVVSQIALAVPLLLLYELSILACKWIQKKRKIQEETELENA